MTVARKKLVDLSITRIYHCISKCTRSLLLLGDDRIQGGMDRKAWLEKRLQFLSEIFAISIAGYSVLNNHLHTILRIDSGNVRAWTATEVARRWFRLHPPRDKKRKPIEITEEYLEEACRDQEWVEEIRERLQSMSWFMKNLKEPLARLANEEEKCQGTFFEPRFKSIAILDEAALLAACVYVDLNPVAAGIAKTPESSPYTSVKERIEHVRSRGKMRELLECNQANAVPSSLSFSLEDDQWLIPIDARRSIDSDREGLIEGLTLGNYLLLVEQTGRKDRAGKSSISADLDPIFDRLGITHSQWHDQLERMKGGKLIGTYAAGSRDRLREVASDLGVRHLVNLYAKIDVDSHRENGQGVFTAT